MACTSIAIYQVLSSHNIELTETFYALVQSLSTAFHLTNFSVEDSSAPTACSQSTMVLVQPSLK